MAKKAVWDAEPDVLFAKDVSRLLGVSQKTARSLMHSGAIPARKVGAKWIVSKVRLKEFVECR